MRQRIIGILLLCLATTIPVFADNVVESVNATSTPSSSGWWGATDVGWTYTPSTTYVLSGVMTKFGAECNATCPSTVTLVVEDSPGGTVLASGSFTPLLGTFSGATFSIPITFTAGTTYFIGFENVAHLPINLATQSSATQVLLGRYYDYGGATFDSVYVVRDNPILEFLTPASSVPEPSSLILFTGGILGVFGTLRRKLSA